jgi:hypothetical protein
MTVAAIETVPCWPWSLRYLQAGDIDGGLCRYCRRDVAKPRAASGIIACLYCAIERGITPAVDEPLNVPLNRFI